MADNYDRVLLPAFVYPHAPDHLNLRSLHEVFPEHFPKVSILSNHIGTGGSLTHSL